MRSTEFLYLIYYSVKKIVQEIILVIKTFKKPVTWFYVSIGVFIYGIMSNSITLINVALPLALVMYVICHKIEGMFKQDMFISEIKRSYKGKLVQEYYDEYLKKCAFKKEVPLTLELWAESKRDEILKK